MRQRQRIGNRSTRALSWLFEGQVVTKKRWARGPRFVQSPTGQVCVDCGYTCSAPYVPIPFHLQASRATGQRRHETMSGPTR